MIRPIVLAVLAVLTTSAGAADRYFGERAFDFIALGDMPYTGRGVPQASFDRLIAAVNKAAPDFVIHVGDIKDGSTSCDDARLGKELDSLNTFELAVIYTPGDNEWTDCHRKNNGGFDPLERLAKLREMYFPAARSLGRKPIALVRQGDAGIHRQMVENARWSHKGVTFATVHVVGSNNNFEARDPQAAAEFFARDAANVAWLGETFAEARNAGSVALVLAMQADMFVETKSGHNGFSRTLEALAAGAEAFARPVLIVYGDSHLFTVNQPLENKDRKRLDNVTFLQVFGDRDVHAVRVVVDPDLSGVFAFIPFYVRENLLFAK